MVNAEKKCQQLFCDGNMVKVREQKAHEHGTSPDATGFLVDIYECDECGAEDWD